MELKQGVFSDLDILRQINREDYRELGSQMGMRAIDLSVQIARLVHDSLPWWAECQFADATAMFNHLSTNVTNKMLEVTANVGLS